MVKKLLFSLLLMLSIHLVAQTTQTVTIDWDFGSNPSATGAANASIKVEVGDTVTWLWLSNGHNVVSNAGANESFNSGTLQDSGTTFSKTFNSVGSNDYVCTPHSGDMFGTITVVAEGVLSISEANLLKFEMFPNPASDKVTIQLPSGTEKATVQFYDYLGRLALTKKVTSAKNILEVNSLSKGVYMLKVVTEDKVGSQKFIKK